MTDGQAAIISFKYRYAEDGSHAVSKEAEGIAQGLIDSLRRGMECQTPEKIG